MLRNPRLVVLHLVGNAVLLAAASMWLLIPEAHVWQLVAAAFSALLMILMFLWIHSGTFAYAAEPAREKFRGAFLPRIGRLVWLAIGFFILFWCMRTVDGWTDSIWQTSGYLYSKAPSFLRPTSGPVSYGNALAYVFFILEWYVIPCILLPVIAARVIGISLPAGLRTLGRWKYWLSMAVTGLAGVWVTRLIMNWTPGMTLNEQMVSLVLRLGAAYVLATAAWLITVGVLGFFVGGESADATVPFGGLRDRIFPAGGENRSVVRRVFALISDRPMIWLQLAACFVAAIASRASNHISPSSAETWKAVTAIVWLLLLLIAFLWAYAGTLVYATDLMRAKFHDAFRFRARRMGWLLLGLVILLLLSFAAEDGLWMLNSHDNYVWLISRAIIVTNDYLLPCLLLPWVAVKVAGNRLREGMQPLRRWQYWAGMALIVFVAGWISDLLSPGSGASGSLWTEAASAIRLTLADLPLIVGGVAAASLVSCFVTAQRGSADLVGQSAS
jgi:hypothetical protein